MKGWKSYVAGLLTAFLLCGLVGTAGARTGKVMQELEYRNIQVTLDGKKLDLRNAIGETVEPFMFGGTNYLPVRALAEALGLQVAWDGAHATVALTTPKAPAAPTQTASSATSASYIGEAAAKAAALRHAGLAESSVTWIRSALDYDNGRAEYDVEFYSGNTEYDYEIDALTGEILSFDHDAEYRANETAAPSGTQNAAASASYIGEAAAKAAALRHAGLSESGVTQLKVKLDRDDGRVQYEVEFHAGRTEYSYDIDAVSGAILDFEKDTDD